MTTSTPGRWPSCCRDQKASTSYLQRRLLVGYNRAADLIERMEREGVVSAAGYQWPPPGRSPS